jgi:hypothetical protein
VFAHPSTEAEMLVLATLSLAGLVVAGLCASADPSGRLPIPEAWSTHYACFLVANPAYVPGSQASEAELTAAHIQYQLGLQEEGHAIAAGGLGNGLEERIIGLTVVRAGTLDEARALADADPAVRAGRLRVWVREWWVPTKYLP